MINDPVVVAQIMDLHQRYETALVSNDVEALRDFFWDSEFALRFGVGENLYGAKEIGDFRRNRSPIDLRRTVENLRIVTFDEDCAIVTLEFIRSVRGIHRNGRQSQVWRKFENGWKIVSAHVSFMAGSAESYLDHASALVGLPIPPEFRDGVRTNIDRSAAIARPLLEFAIDDQVEAAGVFEP
jgi:ketosteroid isomerase-like protein